MRKDVSAIMLASRLIRAVFKVRLESLSHLGETLTHIFYTRGLFVSAHIADQRKQSVPPKADVGSQDLRYIGEELLCVYFFQNIY